ncbi:MAG: ATP-dependent 6-phosphofructokinase, partial [Holophagales bacterium]|nr:ATP-dependent 6-phosphofructokinase [Holophagales bacterium]
TIIDAAEPTEKPDTMHPAPARLPAQSQLEVPTLGPATVPSPLRARREEFAGVDRVLSCSRLGELEPYLEAGEPPPSFEMAGARESLFFDPAHLTCGIVSCGGLCPGINNVIRSLVLTLVWGYGVRRILGFRYGYAGVAGVEEVGPPVEMSIEKVESIHEEGGTVLGSSRGPQELARMVDNLMAHGVGVLFAIGGDGTLRGASALAAEIRRRGLGIAVVGIPKTIDNDILWIERSFGFATAVEEARKVIVGAHAEAQGARNGIGLVKLMGRESGFITAHASLANSDVNFCLVPEVPFTLEGAGGFLETLEQRLRARHHAVIVVAEGAAQELMAGKHEDGAPGSPPASSGQDASGNPKLLDVGPFLKAEIRAYLRQSGLPHTIKYIDPSYIVRSLPASSLDAEYCLMLGQHAVHAGMAGRTDMVVGYWNRHFTHVPIPVAVAQRKRLDPSGAVWHRVLEATGQPASLVGKIPDPRRDDST